MQKMKYIMGLFGNWLLYNKIESYFSCQNYDTNKLTSKYDD